MADALPPLPGLSVNANPPPGPPPTTVRDLPPEIADEVLASYLAKLKLEELCEANLLQMCMLLRGTNQCNDPNDPLWKAACARFGLTERLVGGTPDAPATPTWHVTFLAMCREVATMVKYSKTHNGRYGFSARNLGTFADLMDGYLDVSLIRGDNYHIMQLWFDSVRYGMICTVYLLLKRIDNIVDVKYFNYGADAGDYRGLYTALWQLSGSDGKKSRLAIIDMLIAAGADVNATDERGYTPLHRAAESGNVAIVERLLAANADANPENPFYEDDFYEEGVGARGFIGQRQEYVDSSPLDTAFEYHHHAIVKVLLEHGARVTSWDRVSGFTPLMYASEDNILRHIENMYSRTSRDGIPNVNSPGPLGRSALMFAVLHGHLDIVEFLLAKGANVHMRDIFGDNALTWASIACSPPPGPNCVRVLKALRAAAARAAAAPRVDLWDEE